MTSEETGNGPSAAKLGGVALIGVGVVAGAFGMVTALSGARQPEAQPPPDPPSREQSHGQSSHPPSPEDSSSATTSRPTETSTKDPGDSGQSQRPPETGSSDDANQSKIVVRVYNNSTIKNLAHKVAEDFRSVGYSVPEVGNYSAGRIYTTTVYFRPGTGEEAQAREIAERFDARLEPRFEGLEDASPGVIAIITNDYSGIRGEK